MNAEEMDKLEGQFMTYQTDVLPESITSCDRPDTQWHLMSQLKDGWSSLFPPITLGFKCSPLLSQGHGGYGVAVPVPKVLILAEQWLGGQLAEQWLEGQLAEQWLEGQLAEQWLEGQLAEQWLEGQLAEQWLEGQLAEQWLDVALHQHVDSHT
ncbi:unnamed protein product [Gadus morhua 'NCC']